MLAPGRRFYLRDALAGERCVGLRRAIRAGPRRRYVLPGRSVGPRYAAQSRCAVLIVVVRLKSVRRLIAPAVAHVPGIRRAQGSEDQARPTGRDARASHGGVPDKHAHRACLHCVVYRGIPPAGLQAICRRRHQSFLSQRFLRGGQARQERREQGHHRAEKVRGGGRRERRGFEGRRVGWHGAAGRGHLRAWLLAATRNGRRERRLGARHRRVRRGAHVQRRGARLLGRHP
mmetsp:Transcript_84534/g.244179  ORF Transcript_84534/g.244179 Transcript_84534/m.244179 type:complete len:231 (-) Transcript_84534:392-1084(-)